MRDVRVLFTGEAESLVKAAAESGIALKILGDESDTSGKKLDKWQSHIPFIGDALDGMNRELLNVTGSIFKAIPGMEGFGQSLQNMSPALAAFMSWGEAIPAVLFIALFAVNALADGIGVLTALLGDLVAPMTLVTGLLGLLGVGFVLAAQKAFGKGGALAPALAGLKKQFDTLTTTLEHRFMPIFRELATDASQVLSYFNRIAKLPLAAAFQSLATTGVQAVTKFLQQAGHMLAQPIRLAFKIAFGAGTGGNEISSAVSGLWNQFIRFWTGYTQSKDVLIGGQWRVKTSTVDGAFQPFIDWFNRHDFSKQGFKIANTIMEGVKKITGPLSTLLGHIFLDAAGKSITQMWGLFERLAVKAIVFVEEDLILPMLTGWWPSNWTKAWHFVANLASGIVRSIASKIESALGGAWNRIKTDAQNVWNYIKHIFSQALSLHISVPSVPGLSTILHDAGGLIPSITSNMPSIAGGGNNSGVTIIAPIHVAGNVLDGRQLSSLVVKGLQQHARQGGIIPLRPSWQSGTP